VKFPRPRERKAVMEHPDYYKLREYLIEFLEVHAYRGESSLKRSHLRAKPVTEPAEEAAGIPS
jgi:hypothetical protein